MSKFTAHTVFQSTTRLYTNFHAGEHNEDKVLTGVKTTLTDTLRALQDKLTEDAFVESVLTGAAPDYDDAMVTSERLTWKVTAKYLTKENAKWVLKLFKSPQYFFRSLGGVYDSNGRLCLDILSDLTLSKNISSRVFSAIENDLDYKQKKTFLHSMFNVVAAVKYMYIHMLQKTLAMYPGIGIEGINDLYTVEVDAIDGRMEFERIISDLCESEKTKEIFELSTDKLV